MDILTFLWLVYRVINIILCYPGNQYTKNQINRIIRSNKNLSLKKKKKSTWFKWTYGHSGNDYRVATLSKSYQTTTGITMQSLKSIGQF